jgi:hypothetical protein
MRRDGSVVGLGILNTTYLHNTTKAIRATPEYSAQVGIARLFFAMLIGLECYAWGKVTKMIFCSTILLHYGLFLAYQTFF